MARAVRRKFNDPAAWIQIYQLQGPLTRELVVMLAEQGVTRRREMLHAWYGSGAQWYARSEFARLCREYDIKPNPRRHIRSRDIERAETRLTVGIHSHNNLVQSS